MCSIAAQRIAEIGKAIDDLATTGKAEAGPTPADADPIVARVAELWAQLAELDPEMGKRVVGYQKLSTPTDLQPAGPRINDSRGPTMSSRPRGNYRCPTM